MIEIKSKKEGFRRCGVAHAREAAYPDNRFTAAELAILQAEPMLTVTIRPDKPAAADPVMASEASQPPVDADQSDEPAAKPKGKGKK